MRPIITLFLLSSSTALAADVDRVPEDFATIAEAVERGAAPIIEVGPGTWTGAAITRPVALVGNDSVIASGPDIRRITAGFTLPAAASGTTISGFAFDCRGDGLDLGVYGSAKRLKGVADRVTVSDNTFHSCVQGVTNAGRPTRKECDDSAVDGGSYWTVNGNIFDGFATQNSNGATGGGSGVVVYNATFADIFGNAFVGRVEDATTFSTSGINVAGCIDCTIADNSFEVGGGRYHWAAVSNFGALAHGAVASRGLLLVDNDATADSTPAGVNFRSYDSFDTGWDGNHGFGWVDHSMCGDATIDVFVD